MNDHSQPRFDRRDILKKSAVAGAVAWSAPAILSSRALASNGSPSCPRLYVVKIDGDGACGSGTILCADAISSAAAGLGHSSVYVASSPSSIVTRCSYEDDKGGTFILKPGFTPVAVVGYKGNTGCTSQGNATHVSGKTYKHFTGQSHIYVLVCGPVVNASVMAGAATAGMMADEPSSFEAESTELDEGSDGDESNEGADGDESADSSEGDESADSSEGDESEGEGSDVSTSEDASETSDESDESDDE